MLIHTLENVLREKRICHGMIFHTDMLFQMSRLLVAGFPPGRKHQEAKVSRRVGLTFLVLLDYMWFVFRSLQGSQTLGFGSYSVKAGFELDRLIRQPVRFFFQLYLEKPVKCSLHPLRVDLRTRGQAGNQAWGGGGCGRAGWGQAPEGSGEQSQVLWINY